MIKPWFQSSPLPTWTGALELTGPIIIGSDTHAPAYSHVWCNRFLQVADKQQIGKALIAGDLLEWGAFTHWDPADDRPKWTDEMGWSAAFLWVLYSWFDTLYVTNANHENRVSKSSEGRVKAQQLLDAILSYEARRRNENYDPSRIVFSQFSYSYLDDDWLIAHPISCSVNPLTVANDLAMRYHKHVIAAHSHKCSLGFSRCGNYMLIDSGGMFDESRMAWRNINVSKAPAWKNGFVLYKDGHPELYHERMNWAPLEVVS